MTDRDPFDQLTGAFDNPVVPAPEFADRLRTRVLAELADGERTGIASVGVKPVSGGAYGSALDERGGGSSYVTGNGRVTDLRNVTPAGTPRAVRARRQAPRLLRWLPALEVAAAVLLVLTLFGQLIGPETIRNAVIPDAFQPAESDAPSDAAMWGANPGRTWVMAESAPDLAGAEPRELAPGTDTLTTSTLIHGDRLFRAGYTIAQNPEPLLEAIEVATGKTLWRIGGAGTDVYGNMAATRDTLLFIRASPRTVAGDVTGELVALDSSTGKVRWSGPGFGALLDNPLISPIIIGDTAYFAKHDGQLFAVSVATGDLFWQGFEPDPIVADNGTESFLPGGLIAADDRAIYTALADGSLEAYDQKSGNLLWTAELKQSGADVVRVSLAAHAGRVIATIHHGIRTEGEIQLRPVIIASFDAQTGDRIWSETTATVVGEPVLFDETIVVPVQDGFELPARLLALDLKNGNTRWELRDGLAGTWTRLSGAGDQIYVLGASGRLSVVEDGRIVHVWSLPTPTNPVIRIAYTTSALLADDRLYIAAGDGSVHVLSGKEATRIPSRLIDAATVIASPSPATTPQVSPVPNARAETAMFGANPGRTWEFAGGAAVSAPQAAEVLPATEGVEHGAGGVVSGDTLVRMVPGSDGPVPTRQLEALSLSSGTRRWIVPMTVDCIPAIAGDRLFVVTAEFGRDETETFVLALDLGTGTELWRSPIAGPRDTSWTSAPLVVDSTVFVANDVGAVYALDTATGALRWQASQTAERADPPSGEQLIETAGMTAADRQHLYVITAAADLLALDLQTGDVSWRVPLVSQYGSMFLYAGVMTDGSSVILDLVSGDQSSSPSGGGTMVANATVVGLDARSGQQRWVRRGIPPKSVRALADGLVIAALLDEQRNDGSGWITALRATDGTEAWRYAELPTQSLLMSVIDGQILAVDPRGNLVALDLMYGRVDWEAALPVLATYPPIVTQDHVVVLGAQGEVALFATDDATSTASPLPTTPAVATPAPDGSPQASPAAELDGTVADQSMLAGGSWTFGGSVPAKEPGVPVVIPATSGVAETYGAEVAGDLLVRLVARKQGGRERGVGEGIEVVSLTTGERVWAKPLALPGRPVVAGGRVFVMASASTAPDADRWVIAFDLATGAELWRAGVVNGIDRFVGSSLVVGSTLYLTDSFGAIEALDVATGVRREQWRAMTNIERAVSPDGERLIEFVGMSVADDRHIYTTTADGVFRTLDLETGGEVWNEQIVRKYGDLFLSVTAMTDGDTVIVNASTRWDDLATPDSGTIIGNTITLGLDAEEGRPLWQRSSEAMAGARVLAGDIVLADVTDETSYGARPLTALRADDGQEAWHSDDVPYHTTAWSVAGGHALVTDPGGALIAVALDSGEVVWRAPFPPFQPANPPIVTEDAIVVVSQDGRLVIWRI